jgi:hypothetical protein
MTLISRTELYPAAEFDLYIDAHTLPTTGQSSTRNGTRFRLRYTRRQRPSWPANSAQLIAGKHARRAGTPTCGPWSSRISITALRASRKERSTGRPRGRASTSPRRHRRNVRSVT